MGYIKPTFHKYIVQLQVGLAILFFIFIIYLLLSRLELPIPYIQVSDLHKLIILNGELLLLLVLYNKYFKEGWNVTNFKYYLRDFLILNCLFLLPFIIFYTDRSRKAIPIIRSIQPYLSLSYYFLLAVTVFVVLITQQYIKFTKKWLVLLVIPVLYLFLLEFGIPIPGIRLSTLHKIIFLIGEFLVIYVLYTKHLRDVWSVTKFEYFLRDFLIANCLFLLPFITFYTNRSRADMLTLRTIRPYLLPIYYALLAITIFVVVVTQPYVKSIKKWLISEIDAHRDQDLIDKTKHATWFTGRLPNVTGIHIVGQLATKVSPIGWRYILIFLALATIGLILRLWNLDVLPPYMDETYHLVTAKAMLQGLNLDQVTYRRSLYTVTVPVLLFFKVFDINLWTARFVGVLANLLALIPLYLLGKRINKPIALIAIGLFVFSPWVIAVSRYVREYAYYPLFFYLIVLVMVKFYEAIPDKLVLLRDYRILFNWNNLLFVGLLGFIPFYIYRIDPLSTFMVALTYYPVLGLLLLRKLDWRNQGNTLLTIILLSVSGVAIGLLLVSSSSEYVAVNRKINDFFIVLFYDSPPQQWYFNRPYLSIGLLMLALLATPLWDTKKFILPFTTLTYITTHVAFSIFNIHNERPRYAIAIEFWHIVLMAVGLYAAYLLAAKILKNRYKWVIILVLLLLFWNIPQTFKPIIYNSSGRHPITDEYHADMAPSYSFLLSHANKDDVLVTTIYLDQYYQFIGELSLNKVIYYTYDEPDANQVIYTAIETYTQGWIVLDYPRGYLYTQPLPLEDFTHAGKKVQYLGWFGDAYILRWSD